MWYTNAYVKIGTVHKHNATRREEVDRKTDGCESDRGRQFDV